MYKIRELKKGEEGKVKVLVLPVFEGLIASAFSEAGVKEFLKIIEPDAVRARLDKGNRIVFVAEEASKILGLIEFKDFHQISLFFVGLEYQKRGIGRGLLDNCVKLARKNGFKEIKVNSSPNSVEIYERLGFKKMSELKEKNNIPFVEMSFKI